MGISLALSYSFFSLCSNISKTGLVFFTFTCSSGSASLFFHFRTSVCLQILMDLYSFLSVKTYASMKNFAIFFSFVPFLDRFLLFLVRFLQFLVWFLQFLVHFYKFLVPFHLFLSRLLQFLLRLLLFMVRFLQFLVVFFSFWIVFSSSVSD